eukprot:COSAG04_NODE_3347_length_2907_cov_4.559829_3_plen_52_part_00
MADAAAAAAAPPRADALKAPRATRPIGPRAHADTTRAQLSRGYRKHWFVMC